VTPEGNDARAAFAAMGEVGADLAAVDWSATPLGPIETWPQSLRTVAGVVLSSRFSMWMAWGPELTFLCNDAYRRTTLGKKYPWALGRPAQEVWAEIWAEIGPRIEHVLRTGEATWDEALLLFLERSGYVEETYHTFSYSPLADDAGAISGMLCVVTEDTERVVAARRMATLRDLSAELTSVQTEAEVLERTRLHLAGNPRSIPFALVYLFEEDAPLARLAATVGISRGHEAAPPLVDANDPEAAWPAGELLGGRPVLVEVTGARFGVLPTGEWREPPEYAYAVPLRQQGQLRPWGFLVTALNRYRPFDRNYRGFLDLVGGQIAAGLGSARAYETERRRAEQLTELDRAKTRFFTNISHELRTPLTLILGPVEDALAERDPPLPASQRERLEMVRRNAARLLHLVNDLLDVSRIEAGQMTGRYEQVDLSRYTAEVASLFRSAIERAGLRFELELEPVGDDVYVDRAMWSKIVLNLLSNAVKFTFEGSLRVSLRRVDDAVELAVADTGIGIAPEDQPRLFERFQRIETARGRTHEGSGIGLALVAELVSLHGGEVRVESAPGEGTTFTVRLPTGRAHLPDDQVVAEPAPAAAPVPGEVESFVAEVMRWLQAGATPEGSETVGSGTGHGEGAGQAIGAPGATGGHEPGRGRARVLVVDDNADMRRYISRLLAAHYDVVTAGDGEAALDLVRADPPDLVVTDVMMPRLDGLELLRRLRADPATVGIPVVILSARAGEEGVVEGLEAGADDYLVKPFSARELVARVQSNIELDRTRRTRDELARSQVLLAEAQRLAHVGSWEIDLADRRLSGSDELLRILGLTAHDLEELGYPGVVERFVRPEDTPVVSAAVEAMLKRGEPLDFEVRAQIRPGLERWVRVLGEAVPGAGERPVRLRGSIQDTTVQREAEVRLTAAAAEREATAREHRIADELQRSLLPPRSFDPEYLEVATFYRAGVEGTQVGGDWYDVIELGAGRTALVVGDVMGRGVRAAAVMGQLRSAIRAYARLDLPPAEVLELCDALVRDLGGDQIVTCVYGVYDPTEQVITYARAGHLPPMLALPGSPPTPLAGASGPPLGAGPITLGNERVSLLLGAVLAFYTDGLIERRGRDLDDGMTALAAELEAVAASPSGPIEEVPERIVGSLVLEEPDDDVALLVARVPAAAPAPVAVPVSIPAEDVGARRAREAAREVLAAWEIPGELADDVVLAVSELVTNAIVHGAPPVTMRLCRTSTQLIVEVVDGGVLLPRRRRPGQDNEHGRGLQVVASLSQQWGARPLEAGKCVWCSFDLAPGEPQPSGAPS